MNWIDLRIPDRPSIGDPMDRLMVEISLEIRLMPCFDGRPPQTASERWFMGER